MPSGFCCPASIRCHYWVVGEDFTHEKKKQPFKVFLGGCLKNGCLYLVEENGTTIGFTFIFHFYANVIRERVQVLCCCFIFTQALYCGQYLHVLNVPTAGAMLIHCEAARILKRASRSRTAWLCATKVLSCLFVCVCLFLSTLPNYLGGCFKMLAVGQRIFVK